MKLVRFGSGLFVTVALGCGGDVFSGNDAGGDAAPDGGATSHCPSSPPAGGASCTPESLKCEYGSNPDPNCDQLFVCTSGAWLDKTSGGVCAPQSLCPASYNAVPTGQDCAPDELSCGYPEGECICTKSSGGLQKITPSWSCFPKVEGCPSPRPDIGSSCTAPSKQLCDYGACSGGVALSCVNGVWQQAQTLCPG